MVKSYEEINECVALINHNKDQLYLLEGINIKDPVERAFIDNLHAYELALFKKNGRRSRATYLRRAWANHGIKKTVENAVKKKKTIGFFSLNETKQLNYSLEMIVVAYPAQFDKHLLKLALQKLQLI